MTKRGSQRRRRHLDDEIHVAEAQPIIMGPELMEIAWTCGEPMAEYAHVVFATDG